MKGIPPVLLAALFFAAPLVLVFGLYALLTRGRRRLIAEIRERAEERGWKFGRQSWLGDPTALRIEGWGSASKWILKSGGAGEHRRGWSAELSLRFPTLAGEVDLAVFPRDQHDRLKIFSPRISPEAQAKLAALSGTAASVLGFLREAQEFPAGVPEFDATYRVMALPTRVTASPVDAALAQRLLHWPADAIKPHSVIAWRDPFGLHVQVRLPSTPNWPTVAYFVAVAEDFARHLPPPVGGSEPHGFVDGLVARLLGS